MKTLGIALFTAILLTTVLPSSSFAQTRDEREARKICKLAIEQVDTVTRKLSEAQARYNTAAQQPSDVLAIPFLKWRLQGAKTVMANDCQGMDLLPSPSPSAN